VLKVQQLLSTCSDHLDDKNAHQGGRYARGIAATVVPARVTAMRQQLPSLMADVVLRARALV
jgi:hypothetical protein